MATGDEDTIGDGCDVGDDGDSGGVVAGGGSCGCVLETVTVPSPSRWCMYITHISSQRSSSES